ncbi:MULTISPECIES: hypothetical protein [Streptomyces]|uniref:Uncharacterized protein n=1 Tax=Streptomyces tsukubensis (strain DSM 42081 / NBRC 108919 / NRRL 18488 / 9993) TaxID=1114943 RepID=I2N2H0_STRT9|nr:MULTISPECIES: hypothetical protein [Streptomyces]AZK95341.1 hypothetical protein B7R87_16870 [Streptomyces tsukubensis]EIF91217.1 hypothetical protein [Streptomyces tsukubensis NRRL18488]MYS62877.1 hypothetical protein [Streptomyces sp. SID5473]QKM68609.1 hypothetical protein STSU_016925 [Streptomyces tsukubensis NRRL18488]TAI43416.1 hypothetical protein EWI31_16685 [Streptomyces tsukubensis]
MTHPADRPQPAPVPLPALLPAPCVPEAPDGFYDDEDTRALTVRIAPYPGMAANDVVTVHWRTRDGLHREPLRVPGHRVGAAVTVRMAGPYLSSATTLVHYEVEYVTGGTAVSEPLTLNDR